MKLTFLRTGSYTLNTDVQLKSVYMAASLMAKVVVAKGDLDDSDTSSNHSDKEYVVAPPPEESLFGAALNWFGGDDSSGQGIGLANVNLLRRGWMRKQTTEKTLEAAEAMDEETLDGESA